MYDLIIIGAGPGGIALAAEACAAGIDVSKILVLEKAHTHNWAIRQLYPEQKITTANYKGFAAKCEGLLCLEDMTKTQTIEYFDKVINDYKINTKYDSEVYSMQRLNNDDGMRFRVQSSNGTFESRVLGVAIAFLDGPTNRRIIYSRLLFVRDFFLTSLPFQFEMRLCWWSVAATPLQNTSSICTPPVIESRFRTGKQNLFA